MEDYDQPGSIYNSLCAIWDGLKVGDLCGGCQSSPVFVAASPEDYCLKQLGTSYSYEFCDNAATGTGAETENGYC